MMRESMTYAMMVMCGYMIGMNTIQFIWHLPPYGDGVCVTDY